MLKNVDNQNIENWWETAKKTVKESINKHRNNTLKKLKTVFQGKDIAIFHSRMPFKTSNTSLCCLLLDAPEKPSCQELADLL